MKKGIFFLFVFIVCYINNNCAQPTLTLGTKSNKAKEFYNQATKQVDARNNVEAEKLLRKAIAEDAKFIEAYLLLGDVLTDQRKFAEAIDAYKKTIELNPDYFPNTYFNIATTELMIGRYADAKANLEKFITYPRIGMSLKLKADKKIEQCNFALEQIANPVPFNPINMGDSINSEYAEYLPTITADEQTLIITRRVPKNEETIDQRLNEEEDFYISKKINDHWSLAKPLGPPVNTHGNEGAQSISPDGNYFIFTGCNRPDGYGSCDLYISRKIGEYWSNPVNLGPKVNTSKWESQPSIAADGRTLYFVSNRNGTKGGMDIWKAELLDDGTWGNPVNLGDTINTDKHELSPFIHPDNKTLYFASSGHMGMGGNDIFVSRKDEKGRWSIPQNLGYPINTYGEETSLIINLSGDKAYFSAERADSRGKTDLYYFDLPEKFKPNKVTYLKGKVYDALTQQSLEARFELKSLKTGELVVRSMSNPLSGEFLVCIPTENEYALHVEKDGYLFFSEHFLMTGEASQLKPFIKNAPMQPIISGSLFVLNNVFFETAKWDLKKESQIELDKIVDLLNKNKNVSLEISGHTDNIGGKTYNLDLSLKRAKAVCDYLISKGIDANRLTFKGYGDTKPVDTNETDEGRAKNRRTEARVL